MLNDRNKPLFSSNELIVNSWKIVFLRKDGKGYVYNQKEWADFFVGYDFQLYLYNKDGNQIPLPKIPKYIKNIIVQNEKKYRKTENNNPFTIK